MKKWTILLLALVFCAVYAAEQASAQQLKKEDVIKLRVADSLPLANPLSSKGIQKWIARVEELTAGKVKFTHFPAGQMGKANDMLELARSRAVDLAYVGPTYVSGNMPLSGVMELPGAAASSEVSSVAYLKLCQGILLKPEFLKNGIRPVWAFVLPSYEIYNTKREVRLPKDTKGLKLRSGGGAMDHTLHYIGATSISSPPAESYEAVQRGVIDGVVMNSVSIRAYKLDELVKYSTRGTSIGSFVATLSINENVWQKLPPDVQKAMLQAGEEVAKSFGIAQDTDISKLVQEFVEKRGLKVHDLTPDEQKIWTQAMAPVEQIWVKNMKSKGLPGQEVLDERKRITQEIQAKK